MVDYEDGLKREVAEVKFLIHDLRVEKFINEVIHYHVTLNTDLELHDIDQAQILHWQDLQELKTEASDARRSNQAYIDAVKNFSPDRTILRVGKRHIRNIHEVCDLILNPLWGRFDKVISFLPEDSRSVQSRNHYRNCIHWICGVFHRIEYFLSEIEDQVVVENFDIADEIRDFTRNVIRGYVVAKGSARVELQLDRLDTAVIRGGRSRFRRLFFNLVMNAVDALADRKVGVLNITDTIEGDRVVLRVRDTGSGMPPEKIQELLTDKPSLDGEVHSLGFVFVRQTVSQFEGELLVESEVGKGTTITISFPFLPDGTETPQRRPLCEKYQIDLDLDTATQPVLRAAVPLVNERRPGTEDSDRPEPKSGEPSQAGPEGERRFSRCGQQVYDDYRSSQARYPGSIFAIAVTEADVIELFTHRPYERHWNITHEDLSPMFYLATMRGRLEEDDEKMPSVILKAPQNASEYFEFKELPESERSNQTFVRMVHDEYIRVARKLIKTGLPPDLGVQLTDLAKFFPGADELDDDHPFPLEVLARQPLSGEVSE
jgi:hypothetical protein